MQNSRRNRATEFDADATASKDWNCGKSDPGRVLTCMDDAVPSLTTPQFVTEEVTVVAGPSWTKNSMMTFCGTLTGAVDTFDNFHGDNEDCKSVILDPFNVKVAKTGDQLCAPGGDCHFTINLFNPGPIDHNAPVTISDHLKGLSSAQILSIKPPLPCASQPTQIPFSCTSPDNVCLTLGAPAGNKCGPRTFEMVVRLPNDTSAKQFSNCASVTEGERTRSDDKSCHSVSLKPVAAQTPPVTPPAPVAECMRGMILIGGLCQCPPGTRFNGRRCWSDNGTGEAYPVQPGTEIPPPRGCLAGMILIGGVCQCPPGTRFNGRRCLSGIGNGEAYPVQPGTEPSKSSPPTQRPPVPPRCPRSRPEGNYPNCCPSTRCSEGAIVCASRVSSLPVAV